MKCHYKNRERIILRYLARQLSAQEAEAFEAHYVNCDACFRELQVEEDALELIRKEGDVIFKGPLERHRRRQQSRWGKYLNIFPLSPRETARALTVITAVLIMVGSIFFLKTSEEENVLDKIVYNDAPPYSFNPDAKWRKSSNDILDLEREFSEQFLIAMFSYTDRDYQSALAQLDALQGSARQLETDAEQKESFLLLREYYFYRGVSCLALFRSAQSELSADQEGQLLKESIHNLLKANEITQARALNDSGKLNYFLGLAYGFNGERDLAVKYLRMVQSENIEDKEIKYVPQLIDRWSQ